MHIVSMIFIICGTFFLLTGTIGLLRLPDFYTRMHATGKCDTLGSLLILLGIAVYLGPSLESIKIILIMVFVFLTSPTSTHSIGKAAFDNKLAPWIKEKKNDLAT
jgi:multicomponent Na+:H+ antiporter subunit G